MDHIGIETAQNVVVHHEVASIGNRMVAYILDALILLAWIFVCVMLVAISAVAVENPFVMGFIFLVGGIPLLFYDLICEVTMNGQSLGKRSQHIKVARMDGGEPRFGQYLLRWVLRPIDSFYWLGLVVILVNGKGQRLGDLAAGTTVISIKPRLRMQDTLMVPLKPEHQVRFPEAVRLSDAQAALIKEVINATSMDNRWAIVEEMATKVRAAIGNPGEGMKALEFLRTVLEDYVHLTAQAGQQTTNR